MHSIGQAWAHWKHVSHFSVPYSSYRSWSRPRNLCGTSTRTSGYMTVTFGEKNLRSVRVIPLTTPRPGSRIIGRAASLRADHHDGRRGPAQLEERLREQPRTSPAHE